MTAHSCQLPVASCQLPVPSCQFPGASSQVPVPSCQFPVARLRGIGVETGYWTGYWKLVTGNWQLETGYWLLVTGNCLLQPLRSRIRSEAIRQQLVQELRAQKVRRDHPGNRAQFHDVGGNDAPAFGGCA